LLFTALRTTSACEKRTFLTYTLQEKAECVPNYLHKRSNRSTVLRAHAVPRAWSHNPNLRVPSQGEYSQNHSWSCFVGSNVMSRLVFIGSQVVTLKMIFISRISYCFSYWVLQ